MENGICHGSGTYHAANIKDSSVCDYGSTDNKPVRSNRSNDKREEDVQIMRNAYNQRRRFVLELFSEMGLKCFEPEGAFYMFPCIKEFGMTSDEFANRFLREEKVAIIPGTAFGDCGEGFLRVSYAYSIEELKEGI